MGLMRMAARTAVVAGTATAVSGRVAHRQNEKYAAQDQEQYAQQQAAMAAAAPAAAPVDDTTAKLTELANLHAQGILSDEEFAAAKAKALGISARTWIRRQRPTHGWQGSTTNSSWTPASLSGPISFSHSGRTTTSAPSSTSAAAPA